MNDFLLELSRFFGACFAVASLGGLCILAAVYFGGAV